MLLTWTASALLYFGLGVDLLALEGFGIPCLFRELSGFACPGCGMTRALLLASQQQWLEAWRMNPLLFPLFAFAISAGLLRTRSLPLSGA
ncbi:MAG: DUF2752 domain-containing protein [bacterium]|nr:DUF2752 domain-containing protein [bacterium]MCP5040100.1 DUF2752 domain-containing protein [bacterium]